MSGGSCAERVIRRIAGMEECGDSWSLRAAEIRDLLAVDQAEFYRRIYAAQAAGHPLVGLSAATIRYSQANIWEFVALLELFCGNQTACLLEQAGIFFTHPEQMEILGVFLAAAARAVRSHQVAEEQFSSMLRAFGRYERARDVYLAEYFPLGRLMRQAAGEYCKERSFAIPSLAEKNARRLIEFFFQRHVLEARSVFATVIGNLLRQAAAEGYASAQYAHAGQRRRRGQERDGERGGADGSWENTSPNRVDSTSLQRALRLMELEGRDMSLPVLKVRYKRLMKIYHPDINPKGLRRCQEITAAYSLLLSTL